MADAKKRSLLIVLSGPSGVGKDTLRNIFAERYDNIFRSVSVTTRKKGPAETDGKDYYFLTNEEFDKKLADDEILEWDTYNSNRYGTLWSTVRMYVEQGRNVVFALTIPGALAIKRAYPEDTVSVFILPPSMEELEKRLKGRGREDEEIIRKRLDIAIEKELSHAGEFDYRIINDDFDKAIDDLYEIVRKEKQIRGEDV
ncbi:MAG: guanylate kinase [Clostridia bacterium]|nr:guanylate kinase [Clostridia bacterium]